jgi:transposase
MRRPIQLAPLRPAHIEELHTLYRTTKDVRLRTRAQIILLAAEQGMSAPTIAPIVRENEQTVRNWLKRYSAEGIAGLHDAPRAGVAAIN